MNRDNNILTPQQEERLIRKYVDGTATPEEQHLLEMRAIDDPLLQDALEGYEAFPDAVGKAPSFVKEGISKWWLLLPVVLIAAVVWNINDEPKTALPVTDNQPTRVEAEVMAPKKAVLESHTTDSSVSITVIETPEAKDLPDPSEKDVFVFRMEAPAPITPQKPQPIATENEEDIKSIRSMGTPIYHVYDYKLVDYRGVRVAYWDALKPVIGGTPASNDGSGEGQNILENSTEKVAYVDFLQETMELFAAENYDWSAPRFMEILEHFPDDANALFYGGINALRSEDPELAVDLLTRSSQLPFKTFRAESRFYLAQALYSSGNKGAAKKLWERIATEDGFYREQAEEKLK